jgi:RNA polymerase sigma-70 factor (ECF subfamily)
VISWTETFARGLAERDRPASDAELGSPELTAAVTRALTAGTLRWPSLALDPALFVRHLGRCLASWPAGTELASGLGECHAADVYLACAAGHGVREAVEVLAREHLPAVIGTVRRILDAPELVDEVMQVLRHKLFVGGEATAPKILSFSGRAPLVVWLAAVAHRAAQSQRRADGAEAHLRARLAAQSALAAMDPELRYVQARYADRFEEAFRHALSRLSERGRALLRLHVLLGMTLERLAGIYGVDDATISRWLARAREDVLKETGRYMRETFGVSEREFPSLARILTSQMDISILRLLDEIDGGGSPS